MDVLCSYGFLAHVTKKVFQTANGIIALVLVPFNTGGIGRSIGAACRDAIVFKAVTIASLLLF